MADLAGTRAEIEASGVRIALVHLGTEAQAAEAFAGHGLADLPRVSDPDRRLYRAFGLRRRLNVLADPETWRRGLVEGALVRFGIGRPVGDGFQLGGVFLIEDGRVIRAIRHAGVADRPDYAAFAGARRPG